jgi:sulfur-carrier protein
MAAGCIARTLLSGGRFRAPSRALLAGQDLPACLQREHILMAIEVRIPTILRTYTGGEKSIEGSGATLDELFTDLDGRYGGLRDRLVDDSGLRRFVNVYLNDEDVRFLGGLSAPVSDGDTVTVLPAVAGGAA